MKNIMPGNLPMTLQNLSKKKEFSKLSFCQKDMGIKISITAHTRCLNSQKFAGFTVWHTGICIMYPHWD